MQWAVLSPRTYSVEEPIDTQDRSISNTFIKARRARPFSPCNYFTIAELGTRDTPRAPWRLAGHPPSEPCNSMQERAAPSEVWGEITLTTSDFPALLQGFIRHDGRRAFSVFTCYPTNRTATVQGTGDRRELEHGEVRQRRRVGAVRSHSSREPTGRTAGHRSGTRRRLPTRTLLVPRLVLVRVPSAALPVAAQGRPFARRRRACGAALA